MHPNLDNTAMSIIIEIWRKRMKKGATSTHPRLPIDTILNTTMTVLGHLQTTMPIIRDTPLFSSPITISTRLVRTITGPIDSNSKTYTE